MHLINVSTQEKLTNTLASWAHIIGENSKSDDELDACFTDQIEGTVTCSKFNYDFGSSGSRNDSELTSVVSDMDLVCDQAWTVPFTISMYSIAVIIGNMIGTPISDRYGRRPAFIIAAVGTVVFGVPQAFAPNWWSLMAFSMVQHGFMQIGYLAVSVYVVEVLGPTKRHLALIVSLMFAVGYASMSLYSWLLPNWQWFTLCLTIVSVPFIPIAIWVPESPVFLFSRGEYSRADSVLKLISDRSGGTYVSMDESEMAKKCLDDGVEVDVEEETYATMFTSCYFIRTMLSMAYLFFAASIVYYGLAYKAADLPGSVYVNNFLNALVDAAAYVVTALTMEHVGRKLTIGSTFTFGAVACVACGALFYYGEGEDEYSALNQAGRYLSFVGKFCISAVHGLIYVYVAEVYPTSVRSLGTAVSLFGDEIGAVIAPYIILVKIIWMPFVIFGAGSVLAALLTVTLIETRNVHIPNTLKEMKSRKKQTAAAAEPAAVRDNRADEQL